MERFLTDQPADLIRSGKFNQVPLFMGVTQDEMGGTNISEYFLSFFRLINILSSFVTFCKCNYIFIYKN